MCRTTVQEWTANENDPPDLVIECGDEVVDLSNLVPRLPCKPAKLAIPTKKPALQKHKSFRKIYPTQVQAVTLEELDAAEIMARCKRQPQKRLKTRSMDVLGHSRPGAYNSGSSRDLGSQKMEASRYSNHVEEHMQWANSHFQSDFRSDYSSAQYQDHQESFGQQYQPPYGHHHSQQSPSQQYYPKRNQDYYQSAQEQHYHHQHEQHLQQQSQGLQVEIAPGVMAAVRGSEETWKAIEEGYSINADCFICSQSLICIADADYVLCPDCRVVSPTQSMERKMPSGSAYFEEHRGGVGLGLKARPRQRAASIHQSSY